jgi:hypothetical protein
MDPVQQEGTTVTEHLTELQKITKTAEESLRKAKKQMKARWDRNK